VLFELCLLLRFFDFLQPSKYFSLVSKITSIVLMHATYIVIEVLNYFNKQHTIINIVALDISKTFDKVNHVVLFNKLLDRAVPVCLVKVLVSWCGKCNAMVRWNNGFSRVFHICAGVRQGGILSPLYSCLPCALTE